MIAQMAYKTDDQFVTEGLAKNRVYSAGQGKPVVFLHGPFGQDWNPFLSSLAQGRQIFMPETPGADEQNDLLVLLNHWDLLIYYDELFDRLGLDTFDLVGHSFGGMVAAEYAAAFRHRVNKLVLIDPMGLWLDEQPVGDFVNGERDLLNRQLWANGAPSDADPFKPRTDIDPVEATEELLRKVMSIAAAANFAHPIPERGLARRLHRIAAPTQIIWGEKDGFVPPVYAELFRAKIPGARVATVADAAHHPHIEQEAATYQLVRDFLDG